MTMKKFITDKRGFTIVELMIATTVLSVLLLLATAIMTSIGGLYTKGIHQSDVQDAARTIVDDVTQNAQLSNGVPSVVGPTAGVSAYCIGSTRYSFVIGQQVTDATHGLWRDTVSGGCTPADFANLGSGVEMVPAHSRLTSFSISSTSPYAITVGVAYGDDDLFTDPSHGNYTCKGSAGDQFCATSALTTTVVPRIHQ
jgi:prepilin-type N-terminal cleavage/methylation domain-containing protein